MVAERRTIGPFPGRQPTHPGAILREDVLPELRMPVAEFATRLGVSRQMLVARVPRQPCRLRPS